MYECLHWYNTTRIRACMIYQFFFVNYNYFIWVDACFLHKPEWISHILLYQVLSLIYFEQMVGFTRLLEHICHRTDQFIRAQVQKQSPKRSNSRTWAHINPVVNRNLEGFQTNLHTTKITVIQHNISYVTTFRIRSQIGYIITESLLLQNKSCKTCGSK